MTHDRAAFTRRLLLAIGLTEAAVACSAPAREPSPPPPAGSVSAVASSAPATASPPATAAAPADPQEGVVAPPVEACAPQAASTSKSPPTPQQRLPRNDHQPTVETRDVCRRPEAATPPRHYPAPYDRCQIDHLVRGDGEMSFSTCLTDETRRKQPEMCCYHSTIIHNAGRPLRLGGTSVRAPLVAGAWG